MFWREVLLSPLCLAKLEENFVCSSNLERPTIMCALRQQVEDKECSHDCCFPGPMTEIQENEPHCSSDLFGSAMAVTE